MRGRVHGRSGKTSLTICGTMKLKLVEARPLNPSVCSFDLVDYQWVGPWCFPPHGQLHDTPAPQEMNDLESNGTSCFPLGTGLMQRDVRSAGKFGVF